mgnify:FL=1
MERILNHLAKATTVQVLYIQNFPDAMQDAQLVKLTEVLKLGFIWGLNIGELSRVSKKGWIKFTKQLAQTNVTHMYASENTLLTPKMKIAMMDVIRENRKADKRHCNKDNKDIINAVTNMWFNPKRSKKYQKQFQTAKEGADCAKSSGMLNNVELSSKRPLKEPCLLPAKRKKSKSSPVKVCSLSFFKDSKALGSSNAGDYGPSIVAPLKKPQPVATKPQASPSKSKCEVRKPADDFAIFESLKEIRVSRLSERQQIAYVVEQSERTEILQMGSRLLHMRVQLFSNTLGTWRSAHVVYYSEKRSMHTLKFGATESCDVNLRNFRVKFGNNHVRLK